MKQARLVLRLWSLMIVYGLIWNSTACQQSNPLQGTIVKPDVDKKEVKDSDPDEDADERISPPNNIVGSYLICQEQEQLINLNQSAVIDCGVYLEPAHAVIPVASLNQWQLSGSDATLKALATDSASVVRLSFLNTDLVTLKASVQRTKLRVRLDSGEVHEGSVADLLPAASRLSAANANKAGTFVPVWNEGFEGSLINSDWFLFHDTSELLLSTAINWVSPTTQNISCGMPVFELMRYATLNGAIDNVGAAEGTQFIDTDSACWPEDAADAIRGPSNLAINKDISLTAGRVYRVSFKVRQQPLPNGVVPGLQGLQVKINKTVVKDLRAFSDTWQEISFDWVAGSGMSRIEWVDVGAADDSEGILLDDLRVQAQNF